MAYLSLRRVVVVVVVAPVLGSLGAGLGVAACAGEPGSGAPLSPRATATSPSSASSATSATSASSASPTAAPRPAAPGRAQGARPDAAALLERLRPDLEGCYSRGKKATPEMADGRLILNASIAASGKPECVIPSDHSGLTQEVEDCMSARFAGLELDEGTAWSVAVPVAVRGGAVKLGVLAPDSVVLESVETLRMPDAFDVLESLEPRLQACLAGVPRGSGVKGVLVGARVGADGRPRCALATSRGALPAGVADCAAGVLRAARFPPPKRGAGLVLVPIGLAAAR